MSTDLRPGAQRRIVIATPEPAVARILSHKLAREGHRRDVCGHAAGT